MEDVGLKSHQWMCCDQGFVGHSLKVYAEFVVIRSEVYCWSDCPQLRVYCWSDCPQLRVYAGV